MRPAPIVLFVYNRPEHTKKTLDALVLNDLFDQSDLYIYADGPKANATAETLANIYQTREVIKNGQWGKKVTVIEAETNKGLANSIINGVTQIVNKYGNVIVLEDDLVTHPFFLTYMNKYLELYEHNEKVISIHGYMYPVKKKIESPFFLKGADCWGWATWKRGWNLFEPDAQKLLNKVEQQNLAREFDFNNSYGYTSLLKAQANQQVDSWAIRWYASAFWLDKLTLYPPVSLVQNIGMDGSGTHKDQIDNNLLPKFNFENFKLDKIEPIEDIKAKQQIELFFKGDISFLRRIKNYLKRLTQI